MRADRKPLIATSISIPADPCPDLPVERGPEDAGVGAWVVHDKYRYLRHYLAAACHALGSWRERVYIDPFCATGRVQVRDEDFTRPGGAAEAWHALASTPGRWTRMYVGDLKSERVRACTQRLRALGASATPFEGPATETVPRMVAAVPRGAICIAFVDPYNLALLDFDMLRSLSTLRRVDLIVNFSTMDLLRNTDLELDPTRARFDAMAPGWRDQPWASAVSKRSLTTAVEGYWQSIVQGLGFTHSKVQPLITNDRQHGIYRLVFFARAKFPHKIWGDIAKPRNGELFG